ncbi:unnamed protein product [Musa hybrid cultivar]
MRFGPLRRPRHPLGLCCPFTTIGFGRELDLSPRPYHYREARGVSVAMRRAGLLRVARFARRLERQSLQDTFRIRNLTVWQSVSSLVGTTRCSSNPCKSFELTRHSSWPVDCGVETCVQKQKPVQGSLNEDN